MKLSTNFITPVRNLIPWLRLTFYVCAVFGFALALLFLIRGVQTQRQIAPLQQHLAKLQKRKAEMKPNRVRLPAVKKMDKVRQQVTELNNLSGGKGWPLARMLTRLEQLLPSSVYLTSLQHRQQSGDVRFIAVASRAEVLTRFLKRLEQEPHFSDVLLVRQTQKRKAGRVYIQYEVKLKERATGV